MICIKCGGATRVYFSKGGADNKKVRHRECYECKARFVSHETIIRAVRGKRATVRPILDSYTSIALVKLPDDAENDAQARCALKHWVPCE